MKTLLILRHAKSNWSNSSLSDHSRPLDERGKADAPRMGKLLKREELMPDLIISSSAERALATAEAVALACDYDAEIQVTRQLYLADPDDFLEALRERGGSHNRVMVVGHNPGIEELVAQLAQQFETMSTAALAQIDLPITDWRELNDETVGTLINVWRPKEVDG